MILSVCPHDKTKTAETTITKLATGIVHHKSSPVINIWSKCQRSRSQGHKVQKHVEDDKIKLSETTITKLASGWSIMSPGYPFNIRSKGQRSRSQSHKVQKHIEGDRVADVNYALYRVPTIEYEVSNR